MTEWCVARRWLLNHSGFNALAVLSLAWGTTWCANQHRETVGGPLARDRAAIPIVHMPGAEPGNDRVQLAQIGALLGDARVVVLGEAALGMHEPLALRNRLFEYLVENLGFTALAVESSFPESRPLANHIAGGPGNAENLLAGTRTWWHEPLEENLQLVHWMRAHNSDSRRRGLVRFYGIDLSYTGPWGSRPTPLAVEAPLGYLAGVDAESARALGTTFQPWLSRLADPMSPWTKSDHDQFTAALDDLVGLLERDRVTYLTAGSAEDYVWAHRAARVAQQTDRMFRVAPTDPPGERVPASAWRMVNARDAAMAENVLWVLEQAGSSGRVLVITHNAHAQLVTQPGGPWDALERRPTSMGQYLRASLGKSLVVIGTSDAASKSSPSAGFDALVVVASLTPARTVRPPK
jgi:erythromycin esterase